MEDIKNYKVLSEIDDFGIGETVTSDDFPESELEVYLQEGRLEEIVDNTPTNEPAPTPEPVVEGSGKYKVIGEIAIKDGQGQTQGHYPLGSVQEFTHEIGAIHVEQGTAEAIVE